ncbi:MAG: hypothetical protein JNK72_25015 [Myxococcales bacterium]|nr:hypothetical protein [Myxococcales bacterium]
MSQGDQGEDHAKLLARIDQAFRALEIARGGATWGEVAVASGAKNENALHQLRKRLRDGSSYPRSNTIKTLAKGLDVNPRWLETGEGKMERDPDEPTPRRLQPEPTAVSSPLAFVPDDGDTPTETALYEEALLLVFVPGSHTLGDVDATRAALRQALLLTKSDADPSALALHWLNAAKALRLRGIRPTANAVIAEAAMTRTEPVNEAAIAEQRRALKEFADERAREKGFEPGSAAAGLQKRLREQREARERRGGSSGNVSSDEDES